MLARLYLVKNWHQIRQALAVLDVLAMLAVLAVLAVLAMLAVLACRACRAAHAGGAGAELAVLAGLVVPGEGPHALNSSEVQSQPARPAAGKRGQAAKNGESLEQKRQGKKQE